MTPEEVLHTPFTSLAAWRREREDARQLQQQQGEQQQREQQQQPTGMEVEQGQAAGGSGSSSAGGGEEAASGTQAAAQQQILSAVLEECLLHTREEVGVGVSGRVSLRDFAAFPASLPASRLPGSCAACGQACGY